MIRKITLFALSQFIFLGSVITINAQSISDQGSVKRKAKEGIRFVCTSLPDGMPEELELLIDAKNQKTAKFPLVRRTPGQYLPIPKGKSIRIGVSSEDVEIPFQTHAIAKKPDSSTRLLAIIVPKRSQTNKYPYDIHIIDEAEFKMGEFYFINLTHLEFAIRFDGQQYKVGKGSHQRHLPRQLNQPRNSPVMISFLSPKPKPKWHMVTRSTWRLRPTRKEVCIFYWDSRSKRPAIKGLSLFKEST